MKIKICGIFREEDVGYVNEARPDYAGFVFAKSRRQVSPVRAAKLREKLDAGIVPVGVFVDAPVEAVAALYWDGIIAIAQLHGEEDESYITELKGLTARRGNAGAPVIKALRVDAGAAAVAASGALPLSALALTALTEGADYLLLDHGAGGTGRSFNWDLLETLRGTGSPARAVPAHTGAPAASLRGLPWFLAGGIGPHNIEAAVLLRPLGIDISSGAETDGLKDREKIMKLVAAVQKYNGEKELQA
jgi:phosphoribosylanthranilate isomerase